MNSRAQLLAVEQDQGDARSHDAGVETITLSRFDSSLSCTTERSSSFTTTCAYCALDGGYTSTSLPTGFTAALQKVGLGLLTAGCRIVGA